MTDTDCPIEMTGDAHIVGVRCPSCERSHRVGEVVAEENDGEVLCTKCSSKLEGLYTDMHAPMSADRLEIAADYLESRGKFTKAAMFREFVKEMEEIEPVLMGFEKWKAGDFSNLERAIERYE